MTEHKNTNDCTCERCLQISMQGKEEMQFARWVTKDRNGNDLPILVDCEEISHIYNYLDKEIKIEDIKTEEVDDNKTPVLAYGILLSCNDDMGIEQIEDKLIQYKGYGYACLDDMTEYISSYDDIAVFKDDVVYGNIPIACLLRTDLDVANGKMYGFGFTNFLRYHNMDILSNIMNRDYLLCIRGVEESYNDSDRDNWKDHINKSTLMEIAKDIF